MPPLPSVTGRECIAALQRAGFLFDRQRGSHTILRRSGLPSTTLSVPVHANKPLKPGTTRALIRQAGLSVEDFISLLK